MTAAVSPDGRHVYLGGRDGALLVFERSGSDGSLEFLYTYLELGRESVLATDFLFSADGRHLYVVESPDNIILYTRDPTTGELRREGGAAPFGQVPLRVGRLALSPDGENVYLASGFDEASLVVYDRDPVDGSLSFAQNLGIELTVAVGPGGAQAVTVSPDGGTVFVGTISGSSVTVFRRNLQTGKLTIGRTLTEHPVGHLLMSPDGRFLYTISPARGGEISILRWNPGPRRLSKISTLSLGDLGFSGEPAWISAVAPTAFDRFYVASSGEKALLTLERRPDGTLRSLGRTEGTGVSDLLFQPRVPPWIAASPDGRNIYAVDSENSLLRSFSTDLVGGALPPIGEHRQGDGSEVVGLDEVERMEVSPDGRNVYLIGREGGSLTALQRKGLTGGLRFLETRFESAGPNDGIRGQDLDFSPDGTSLYVTFHCEDRAQASCHDRILTYRRDPDSGNVTLQQEIREGDPGLEDLNRPRDLSLTPDGRHAYLSSAEEVWGFERAAATGELELIQRFRPDFGDGGVSAFIRLAKNGQELFAFSGTHVARMNRDPETGILEQTGLEASAFLTFLPLDQVASPDDRFWYFLRADRLTILERSLETGSLQRIDVLQRFELDLSFRSADLVALSFLGDEGTTLLIATTLEVLVFSRDPETGHIEFVQSLERPPTNYSFTVIRDFAVAPDDLEIFLASARHGTVTTLRKRTFDCPALPEAACLNEGRFLVDLDWQDARGRSGPARRVPAPSDDSGLLWFFRDSNWEMLVKVLDGCAFNDHFLVFAAATTNVRYDLRVTDSWTGAQRSYVNPAGRAADAITDSRALAVCDGEPPATTRLGRSSVPVAASSSFLDIAPGAGEVGSCADAPDALCLGEGRFRVEASWRDQRGRSGQGQIVPLRSDDSGLLWFFRDDNWEMLVKVLDGCAFNDHYWVFSAATTNVEYTLRVTDTLTDQVQEYFNPLGTSAPAVTDTQAFATCP